MSWKNIKVLEITLPTRATLLNDDDDDDEALVALFL